MTLHPHKDNIKKKKPEKIQPHIFSKTKLSGKVVKPALGQSLEKKTYNDNIKNKYKSILRILGTVLPNKKKVEIGLTYIYGIGQKTALKIVKDLKISRDTKIGTLKPMEITVLRKHVENQAFKLEDNLHRLKRLNIKHLKDIHCFRGQRYEKGLPIRGQRTKTNSRTSRFLSDRRKNLRTGKRGKIIF